MHPSTSIRTAARADLPIIMQLAEATWAQTYSSILSPEQIDFMYEMIYSEEALRLQMQQGQTFLLFLEDGNPVGFAAYSVKDSDAGIYKLNMIYLLKSVQGKGFGKKLLEAVEEEVKQNGARILDLNVNRHNKAKEFYERCGYHEHLQEDIPIGPYWMNDYVMRKTL